MMAYNPYEECEPPVCFTCSECGDSIYHGDTMFRFDKIIYCESCMEDARTEAEVEEPDPDCWERTDRLYEESKYEGIV